MPVDRSVEVLIEGTAGEVVLREEAHVAVTSAKLECVAAGDLGDEFTEIYLQLVAVALGELGIRIVLRGDAGNLVGNPRGVEIAILRKPVYGIALHASLQFEKDPRARQSGDLGLVDWATLPLLRRRRRFDARAGVEIVDLGRVGGIFGDPAPA